MPWVVMPSASITPTRDWTYGIEVIGSYPIWFRVSYFLPDPDSNYSRILLGVANLEIPREHYGIVRLFPDSNRYDVLQIYTPPSFEGVFNFTAKAYRYFNGLQPVTLNFAYWNQ